MRNEKSVPFRYVAKSSRSERDLGCEHLMYKQVEGKWVRIEREEYETLEAPFNCGSGTTGIAAMRQGRSCQLIELDEDGIYRAIIEGRLQGQRELFLKDLHPSEQVDIEFEGELSDDNQNAMPKSLSFSDLFSF